MNTFESMFTDAIDMWACGGLMFASYLYGLYRVSQGQMVHVPDSESGAPEGSLPPLVSPSSQD